MGHGGQIRHCLCLMLSTLLLALLCVHPARAQGGDGRTLVCVARSQPGDTTAQMLVQGDRFDCSSRQNSFGKGDFWAKLTFDPQDPPADDPLVLRFTSVWQDRAVIHFSYADGQSERISFTQQQASRYLTMGAIFAVPVPRKPAALTGVLFEIKGSANLRGILLDTRLVPRSQSQSTIGKLIGLYAAFAGLTLGLLVYNLAVWVALRHRFQLLYCAMLASVMGYAYTASASLMLTFPDIANNDRLRLNYVMLAMAAVTGALFVRDFLGRDVVGQWLNRAITAMIIIQTGIALAFAVLAPWQMAIIDTVYFVGFMAILLLMVPVMAMALIRKVPYSKLFILTWAAPLMASLLRGMHGLNVIPYSLLLDNSTLISLAIEALLSSVVITSRLKQLSEERDQARAEEAVASRIAATDSLTGLLNRRAYLELAIGRKGFHRLILIDIDHFKKINDSAGHDAGDEVLRRVAQLIQRFRPQGALAVRLGGEEFALLIPLGVAKNYPPEELLGDLRTSDMPCGMVVTASIGYSDGLIACDEDWKHLYRQADSALYRAKHDGRDRVCRATYLPRAAALAA